MHGANNNTINNHTSMSSLGPQAYVVFMQELSKAEKKVSTRQATLAAHLLFKVFPFLDQAHILATGTSVLVSD
jgi:hypothetical protein